MHKVCHEYLDVKLQILIKKKIRLKKIHTTIKKFENTYFQL